MKANEITVDIDKVSATVDDLRKQGFLNFKYEYPQHYAVIPGNGYNSFGSNGKRVKTADRSKMIIYYS